MGWGKQVVLGESVGNEGMPLKLLALLSTGAAAVGLLFVFDPVRSPIFPPCPFHEITGFHCPGCGSLRAIHQLLHGHVEAAFRLNPFMALLLPFLGYHFLSYWVARVRGKPLPEPWVHSFCIWGLLGSLLVFWGLRNIPIHPFSLLAP